MDVYPPDEILADLQSGEVTTITQALRWIAVMEEPTGDIRIANALENLLADKRLCIYSVEPIYHCEIRWLAGQALAYERAMLHDDTPVFIENTFYPRTTLEISRIVDVTNKLNLFSLEDMINHLEAKGAFPRVNRVFYPQIMLSRWQRKHSDK